MAFEHSNPFDDPTNFTVTLTKDVSDRVNAKGIPAKEVLLNSLQDMQQLLSDGIRAIQSGADAAEIAKQFDERAASLAAERAKVLAAVPVGTKDIIKNRDAAVEAEKVKK